MVDIYLGTKSGSYTSTSYSNLKAKIDVRTSSLDHCSNIFKVTYEITYDSRLYDIYEYNFQFNFYTGSENKKGSFVFTCYCTTTYNIFNKIEPYYAIFDPDSPFFVGFRSGGAFYYETFENLKSKSYSYYEMQPSSEDQLDIAARTQFISKYTSKIMLYAGYYSVNAKYKTYNIYGNQTYKSWDPYTIVQQMYKKVIFTPDTDEARRTQTRGKHILYSGSMFTQGTESVNRILQDTIKDDENRGYHAIIIYYTSSNIDNSSKTFKSVSYSKEDTLYTSTDLPGDIALFIELIKDCNIKIQYERSARFLNRWIKVRKPIVYKNESELLAELDRIRAVLYDRVTFQVDCKILTRNSYSYNNDSVNVSFENKHKYVIYTHTPNKHYERKDYKVWYKGFDFKTESTDKGILGLDIINIKVYYRNKEPDDENTNPILLVEFKVRTYSGFDRNRYYSRKESNDIIWIPVSFDSIINPDKVAHERDQLQLQKATNQKDLHENSISIEAKVFHPTLYEPSQDDNMLSLLRKTELYFYEQIIVLIDRQKQYRDSDVVDCVQKIQPNFTKYNKQPKTIDVKHKFLNNNYYYYEHIITLKDFTLIKSNFVFIPYICSTKLHIYDKKNVPILLIYGVSGGRWSIANNPDKLFVFFYKKDNLPLMILYCNVLYTPISKGDFHNWKEVETVSGLTDPKILTQLDNTKNMLNLIDLSFVDDKYGFSDKFGSSRSETINVQVRSEEYSKCDLFKCYRHNYKKSSSFTLSKLILTVNNRNVGIGETKTITVHVNNAPTVSHVDVYYSHSNDKKLLVVGIAQTDNKSSYYRYQTFLTQPKSEFWINEVGLLTVNTKTNVIDHLINEDNLKNDTLTYRLDKITEDSTTCTYNNGSISLTREIYTDSKGYNIYRHKPSLLKNKNTFNVLYNDKKIVVDSNSIIGVEKIDTNTIQTLMFDEIETYTLNANNKEHLLIKLVKSTKNYYLFRFNKDGTNWRQLSLDVLEKFFVVTNENMRNKIRNLGAKDPSQQIDQVIQDSEIIKILLDEISYSINSIIVPLERKNGRYNKSDFKKITHPNGSERYIPPIDINSSNINVTDETDSTSPNCLKSKGYYVYKHDLSQAVEAVKTKLGTSQLYLRFCLENNQISLHNAAKNEHTPMKHQDKNDPYVYFYGTESNRPLLLCYNGKAYKAKDQHSYHSKWILDDTIKNCGCVKGSIDLTQDYEPLLKALKKARLGNVLYLYEKPGGRDEYTNKFFTRYKHQEDVSKSGNIDVYKKNDGKRLIIRPDTDYSGKICSFAHVYFNSYDETVPLLLTLTYRNHGSKLYYTLSQFDQDASKKFKNTSLLNKYTGDNQLVHILISENNKLSEPLTFNIGNIKGDEGTSSNGRYNNNKIKVSDEKENQPKLLSSRFKRYRHTPEEDHKNKKACVIYKHEPLLNSHKHPISALQLQNYNYICVYFGSSKVIDPILLEFNDNNTQYYYQKKSGKTLYWEKLDAAKYKNFLNDSISENSIHNNLTSNESSKLLQLLKNLEFDLLNGLVVLIDKQSQYGKNEIEQKLREADHTLVPSTVCSSAQPRQINVKKEKCDKSENGYICCCHTLSLSGSTDECQLRFLIPTTGSKYREIQLWNNDKEDDPTTLSYTKGQNSLYVYFYGQDPRPLLLCYNGKSYRPKSITDYDNKWTKIDGFITCPLDLASETRVLDALSKVVTFLNSVKLESRPEDITVKEPNKDGDKNKFYPAHTFNNKTIQIKVTYANKTCYREYTHSPHGIGGKSSGYRLGDITYNSSVTGINYIPSKQLSNVSLFYNVYDHNHDYPLLVVLEFKYGYPKKYFKLISREYKKWEEIKSSIEGGSGDDTSFLDKLKDLEKPSEKLSSEERRKKLQETIEQEAYKIRTDLGIKVENYESYLFDPKDCKEDKIDWVAVGAGGGGGLVGVGAIVTISVVVSKKLAAASAVAAAATAAAL